MNDLLTQESLEAILDTKEQPREFLTNILYHVRNKQLEVYRQDIKDDMTDLIDNIICILSA